jgi:acetyl-CoA/propionyl-CoA carboxylase biotin carboxyl carrier protein
VGGPAPTTIEVVVGGEGHSVAVLGGPPPGPSAQPTATVSVHVDGGDPAAVAAWVVTGGMEVEVDGRLQRWSTAVDGDVLWLGRGGGAWPVRLRRRHDPAAGAVVSGRGPVTSPMPGTVGSVLVAVGDVVRAGQPLLTVEAMKMEYTVSSTVAGKVTAVHVRPRDQVALDQALALVEPEEGNGQ